MADEKILMVMMAVTEMAKAKAFYATYASSEQRPEERGRENVEEKKFCQSFCAILFLMYSQKRRREGTRTKAFHHRNPERTRLKDPAGIILTM